MMLKEQTSKHVRIKFRNCPDVVEGVITFFEKPENERNLTRTPTPKYSFKLNDAKKTEIPVDFYAIDTIAYL